LGAMTDRRIRLFGIPALLEPDGPRRIGGPPRTLALLLYLVLHRRMQLERKRIAFALWPDAAENEATANLRRHLHALAATLPVAPATGPQWFTTTRVSVTWNAAPDTPGAAVDVIAFEAALAANDEERAVAYYCGPLCPSVDEPWANLERDRFAHLALTAYERLIDRERQRDTQRALSFAIQSLAVDPWHEPTIRALIELRSLAGDSAGARREYHEFAARLEREYAASPDPETTAAYDGIAADAPVRTQPSLPHGLPEVVGRDTEIADALTMLEREQLVTIVGVGGSARRALPSKSAPDLRTRTPTACISLNSSAFSIRPWWRRASRRPPASRRPVERIPSSRSLQASVIGCSSSTIASTCWHQRPRLSRPSCAPSRMRASSPRAANRCA
jgi:DNA-binding SARP family transcriptional activator